MMERKYKFSVDEPRPQVPPPRDFSALLKGVKARIPWYAKSAFWGGAATVAVTTVAAVWWFQSKQPQQAALPNPVKTNQVFTSKADLESPKEIAASDVKQTNAYKEMALSVGNTEEFAVDAIQSREFATISELVADRVQMRTVEAPKTNATWGWKLGVKFDTLRLNTAYLPGEYILARGSKLQIPANAFTDNEGNTIKGEFLILYREFLDPADMLVTSMYMEGQRANGAAPLINNGAFEIRALQHGSALKIQPTTPLLLHFNTLDPALVFSGFHTQNLNSIWKPMFFSTSANMAEQNTKNAVIQDRMAMKRTFGEWIADLFHGRKVTWDTFERVDAAFYDYGIYKNTRTFEIAETGYYASGRAMDIGFSTIGKLHLSCENNEKLEGKLYQVFLNTNMIREYDIVDDKTAIQYSADDRCMLIAIIENSNFIAVLDAGNFDRLVKGELKETDIMLKLHAQEIRKLSDLKNAIKHYGNGKGKKP